MICTFNTKLFLGDISPTLAPRKGAELRDRASTDYGIRILSGRAIGTNEEYGQLSMDVRGSSPQAVLAFCEVSGIVSVQLQPIDITLYVEAREGEQMAALVRENWNALNPGELEPSEIFDAFQGMVLKLMAHQVSDTGPNPLDPVRPDYDAQGRFIGDPQIRNEAFLEISQAQQREEREAQRAALDPMWESE